METLTIFYSFVSISWSRPAAALLALWIGLLCNSITWLSEHFNNFTTALSLICLSTPNDKCCSCMLDMLEGVNWNDQFNKPNDIFKFWFILVMMMDKIKNLILFIPCYLDTPRLDIYVCLLHSITWQYSGLCSISPISGGVHYIPCKYVRYKAVM